MNLVNKIFGFGSSWKSDDPTSAVELMKIPSGQLFLVRPGNVRSSRECIYNDAMATIRRAPSIEHNFQLVITRVFEEGEEDILEEEDENDDKVFLIGEELEFRTSSIDGHLTLVWRDLDGDIDEFYEFIAIGSNKATIDLFAQCMYKAMYERKYKRESDDLAGSELQEFVWNQSSHSSKSPTKGHDASKLAAAMNSLNISSATTPSPPAENLLTVLSVPAELYLWDQEDGHFLRQDEVSSMITQSKNAGFNYRLRAMTNKGQQLLSHPLTSELNGRWSTKLWSFTWNHQSSAGVLSSWCFKFEGKEDFEAFQQSFARCLYEQLNEVSWQKAKAEDQAYVRSSYDEDVEMQNAEDDDDDDDAEEIESGLAGDSQDSEESGESESELAPTTAPKDKERNSLLTVGHRNNRTFVVRGDKIGVFKLDEEDGKVDYAATIRDLGFKGMKSFKPKNMMLHDQDSKMVLMNPLKPHSLFAMDIEVGKVIEEWKVDDNITVDYIAPKGKFAPTTGEQTLVGTSSNALFRIDPRVSGRSENGGVMVENKQYTTKNKFSGLTTTAAGKIAVSSEKGDIRLFDTVGKIAKTALPAMGDPILGIDATADGQWIVATCKPYLLLINTVIGQGRYSGSLGFDRSFPADAKPQPRRLQLRPEHVAYMGHDISFTPARFNTGEGAEENAIVTSTGRFIIAWDFAKVKKGKLDSYVIKRYEDDVVQDNFKFGDDNEIVVALANDVLAVNKKRLKRLPRASLGTPGKR